MKTPYIEQELGAPGATACASNSALRSAAFPVMVAAALLLLGACSPYAKYGKDGDSLGPVDPILFPTENLGEGGNRRNPGDGSFVAISAHVRGTQVGYFAYPVRSGAVKTTEDANKVPYVPVPSAPKAYVFDPMGFPTCAPPTGYVFDPRLDEVRLDEQGSVFEALPSAKYAEGALPSSKYAPVVSRVPVDLGGLPCQQIKGEEELVQVMGLPGPGDLPADGQLLAWLVIDPAAPVYGLGQSAKNGDPGLGLQRWGWFNRYLLAYLDGGVVPTAPLPGTMSNQLLTQKIYVPKMVATDPADPGKVEPGKVGAGYDVLQFMRNEPGYSPLCQVWQYNATDPNGAPLNMAGLPEDEAGVLRSDPNPMPYVPSPVDELSGYDRRFVYCLQVQ